MGKILLVNNAEPGNSEFAIPILEIISETGNEAIFVEYRECIDLNKNKHKGAILTGSPQGNDIVEHHLPYFEWIKNYKYPILGICAGHHITGFMYGAELLRSLEPESGDFEVEIIKPDPIFSGMGNKILVKQMHNDSITLPDKFELLASSDTCINQMMKHREKPLYTCQFHPEFYNHNLIKNFIKLCE